METITIYVQERYNLRDPKLQESLRANGFEATSYLDSIGVIVGQASSERVEYIENVDGVAWIERAAA